MNDYLAIDSGGYVYEQPSRTNCSIWLDASMRSRDGVCQGCKELSALNGPEDLILRYIRTCPY